MYDNGIVEWISLETISSCQQYYLLKSVLILTRTYGPPRKCMLETRPMDTIIEYFLFTSKKYRLDNNIQLDIVVIAMIKICLEWKEIGRMVSDNKGTYGLSARFIHLEI